MSVIDDWTHAPSFGLCKPDEQPEPEKEQADNDMLIGLMTLHGIVCALMVFLISL